MAVVAPSIEELPYPQRYRKNIPFQWVKEHGIRLMVLADGEVTFPKVTPAKKTY